MSLDTVHQMRIQTIPVYQTCRVVTFNSARAACSCAYALCHAVDILHASRLAMRQKLANYSHVNGSLHVFVTSWWLYISEHLACYFDCLLQFGPFIYVYTYSHEEMVHLTKRQYRRQYYLANQKDAILQKKEDYKQNFDARRKANQLAYELKSKQRKLAQ